MIESLQIKNFRCFKNLSLGNLNRINVIVGRNSSGKTALLEAIFLAAANSPEVVLRLRSWRGIGDMIQVTVARESYESIWRDLFFSQKQEAAIEISLKGSIENTRSLCISYDEQQQLALPLGQRSVGGATIIPIVFMWASGTGEIHTVRAEIGDKGLSLGTPAPSVSSAFFASGNKQLAIDNVLRFSELSKQNEEALVLRPIVKEFPYIKALSVELNAGTPMIYAKLPTMKEKIPITNVSDGVTKLLSILLAIATLPQGVILIDELDNGFYYDRLAAIWSVLLDFCRERDVQIFASTHSKECLDALLPVLEEHESEFSLIRMEKSDGECTAKYFQGNQLRSAIEQAVEIRS
jgi:AAA15 family ATPase/GTPase